jgi:hypothetical protein
VSRISAHAARSGTRSTACPTVGVQRRIGPPAVLLVLWGGSPGGSSAVSRYMSEGQRNRAAGPASTALRPGRGRLLKGRKQAQSGLLRSPLHSFQVGATAFTPASDDVGRDTTPAPQSKPVPQTSRPRGADAPLVAIGSGLRIPAAGPAHFRQYSEPAHLTRIPPTGWSGAASSDCPVPLLRHPRRRRMPNSRRRRRGRRSNAGRIGRVAVGAATTAAAAALPRLAQGSSARDRGRGRPSAH